MNSKLLAQADRAMAEGHLDRSQELCESVLLTDPDDMSALLLLGVVLTKKGRFETALPLLQRVMDGDPAGCQAAIWMSRALRKLGRVSDALTQARAAVEREPESPLARHQLGLCLMETHEYNQAADCFRRAAELDPKVSTVFHGLGLALQAAGKNSQAISAFRRASMLAPRSLPALEGLFQSLLDESDSSGAVDCARRMLELQPSRTDSHLRLARALTIDNKPIEAAKHLDKVLKLGQMDGNAAFAAGTIMQSLGRFEEARAQFRRSIELLPTNGSAFSALVYSGKIRESDRSLVDRLKGLSENDQLSPLDQSHVQYGLGKAMEDLGDYESAMTHFEKANRIAYNLKFGDRTFDRVLYAERIESVIQRASRQEPDRFRFEGSQSDVPIFIVGMLRSGTTLIDQILSCHPEIGSVGEQGFWLHNRDAANSEDGLSVDAAKLGRLAESYLSNLNQAAPGRRRVVDKMPDNYLEIPLMHLAFPNAKIIHCSRNPVDTCISIYTTINRLRVDWAHDRENIVYVYRQYLHLMDRWRKWLPANAMMEVPYEELVTNREQVTREMVAFCGLDWDAACLYPENNKRAVATPSAWQVRQSVYRTSIGRWLKYEPWLGEFADLKDAAPPRT
ncbi:MAG: sulfotransferase [Fimbriimonas sp.]|nr:sulfotransferase [Fimbriimonas sp.]